MCVACTPGNFGELRLGDGVVEECGQIFLIIRWRKVLECTRNTTPNCGEVLAICTPTGEGS